MDLFIFILMGIGGGLFGALFNAIQTRITKLRMKYFKKTDHQRAIEVVLISVLNTTLLFIAASSMGECEPGDYQSSLTDVKYAHELRHYFCANQTSTYNDLATLAVNPLVRQVVRDFCGPILPP